MRPLHELARIGIGLPQFLDQRTWLFGLTTRAVRATAITELPPGKAFAGGRIAITRTSTGAASCISNGRQCHQQCCSKRKNADTEHGHDGVVLNQLVSGAGNRASKLHTGSCRLSWSSEREVSEPSVRRAACVAHGVPSNRAGEDIHNQSSSMALAIHDLIRPPSAVSCRLLIAARGRSTAFRAVSALERLS
jgi:hypothetical protein